MRIQRGIDKAHRALSDIRPVLIDDSHDRTKSRGARRGAEDKGKTTVDSDDIVSAIGRDIRVSAGHAGVIVAIGAVGRIEVIEVRLDGAGLVGGHGEDVGEAAAGEDDGFAGLFGLGDGGVGDDLGGADGGDVGAGAGEGGVEDAGCAVVVLACSRVDALPAVAGDAEVAGGVEDGAAGHAELGVFLALPPLVEGRQVRFVVAVGG